MTTLGARRVNNELVILQSRQKKRKRLYITNFRLAFCFVHLCFSSETARVRMFFFFQVTGFDRTTRTTLDPPQTLRQFLVDKIIEV